MIDHHKESVRGNVRCVSKDTRPSAPPGIATRWPTLVMIKLGRITMHRFTEALQPFGIRPRHAEGLFRLRAGRVLQHHCQSLDFRHGSADSAASLSVSDSQILARRRYALRDKRS